MNAHSQWCRDRVVSANLSAVEERDEGRQVRSQAQDVKRRRGPPGQWTWGREKGKPEASRRRRAKKGRAEEIARRNLDVGGRVARRRSRSDDGVRILALATATAYRRSTSRRAARGTSPHASRPDSASHGSASPRFVGSHLSGVCGPDGGNDADERVPVLLRVPAVWQRAASPGG